MADKDVSITVGADVSAAEAALAQLQKTVKDAVGGVKGHFENLTGILEKAQGVLVAFAAVAAGAGAFDKAISATTKFTGEVVGLSKALGITTEEASGLNIALGDIGSDSETYTDALQKLTKQVRTNEAGLNAMGIATRGSNGEFLNGKALMDSALDGLKSYKEGTDRNLAAQVAFGRGAGDVAKLLKLNGDIQEEAKQKAAALGLVIGTDNVAAVKAFKLATNDVNDVLLAVENVIGSAVLPVVTKLANWFSEGGPAAVSVFKSVMDGVGVVLNLAADIFIELWNTAKETLEAIGSAFVDSGVGVQSFGEFVKNVFTLLQAGLLVFKAAFMVTFDAIRGAVEVGIASVRGFSLVAQALFDRNWSGVGAAWRAGMDGIVEANRVASQRMVQDAMRTGQQIADVLNPKQRAYRASDNYGDRATKGGGKSFTDPTAKTGGRMEDTSKAEYAVAKAQFEAALALQKEYLKEAQEGYDDAYKHNLISIREYYDDRIATEQGAIQKEMDAKNFEIRAVQQAQSTAATDRERLGLKAQEIKLTGELTVLTAQYAQVAVRETRAMTEAERQRADGLREIQIASQINIGNSQVAMDRIALNTRKALREESDADAIQEEKAFEDRLTAIQRSAIQQRLELERAGTNDPVKIAALNSQLEDLERQHQVRLTELDAQATLERNKYAIQAAEAVQSSFETLFNDLTNHTKKLSDTFKDFGKSLLAAFNSIQSKKLAEQLFGGGTSGGGMLNDLMKQLFGGSTTAAKAPAGGTADSAGAGLFAKDNGGAWGDFLTNVLGVKSKSGAAPAAGAGDAAAGADPMGDFIKNIDTANSGLTNLSSGGIAGMFKSATDWISKTILGTTAETTQTAVSQTMTTAFAALSEAAYSAAAALSTVGSSGGSSGGGSLFGSLLGGSGGDGADAAIGMAEFASGTDFVPRDMIAMIHEGERITPAKFNVREQQGVTIHQTVNVPPSTSRASGAQTAGAVAGATTQALRRNS